MTNTKFEVGKTYASYYNEKHTMTVLSKEESTLTVTWGKDTVPHIVGYECYQIDPKGTLADCVVDEGDRYYSDLEVQ